MSAVGIDFGTSFSSASWINPTTNVPEIITFNETGTTKIPSVVYFSEESEPLVGLGPYQQIQYIKGYPQEVQRHILRNTLFSIKRKMKRNGIFHAPTRDYSHTDIVALILKKIKDQIESSCQLVDGITSVTLTHPVVFSEWQKDILLTAAQNAGFTNIQLLEEPIAAAIGYLKSNNMQAKGVLVYDFGGGTFDVAYVKIESNGIYRTPLSPQGDAYCGGDDIDYALYQLWQNHIMRNLNRSISPNGNETDLGFLQTCRQNKELLSTMPSATFNEILPVIEGEGIQRVSMELTRPQFEMVIKNIIHKTIKKTEVVINYIRANNYPLDCAILIGGSSRIPLVKKMLEEVLCDVKIYTTGAVDVAVALGASYSQLIQMVPPPPPPSRDCFCIYCQEKIFRNEKYCLKCGKPNFMYNK